MGEWRNAPPKYATDHNVDDGEGYDRFIESFFMTSSTF